MSKSLILLEKNPKASVTETDGVVTSGTVTNAEVLNPQVSGDSYIHGEAGTKNILARYALKTLGYATRTFRQPLQVGIPRQSPILFDVGSYRPVLTVSGITEREPLPNSSATKFNGNYYYPPTYFQLQQAVTQWAYVADEEILLTHLHTNVSSVTYEQYNVAIQNATFGLVAEMPKFWTFEISFVATRPVSKYPSKNI